jgi:hypothetical protein
MGAFFIVCAVLLFAAEVCSADEETDDFESAHHLNTVESYRSFLKKWPFGRQNSAAKGNLGVLAQAEWYSLLKKPPKDIDTLGSFLARWADCNLLRVLGSRTGNVYEQRHASPLCSEAKGLYDGLLLRRAETIGIMETLKDAFSKCITFKGASNVWDAVYRYPDYKYRVEPGQQSQQTRKSLERQTEETLFAVIMEKPTAEGCQVYLHRFPELRSREGKIVSPAGPHTTKKGAQWRSCCSTVRPLHRAFLSVGLILNTFPPEAGQKR